MDDNEKLVKEFGAKKISEIEYPPDCYTFKNGLAYSHRDLHHFINNINKGEEGCIVSGLNPSANLHIGHIPVFDTNMYFQKERKMKVFIPLSDDESYVSLKIKDQEEGLKNALNLTKSLIAYGFDLNNTKIIIDQIYTNIYNLAIKLSRGITLSEVKAVYGYENSQNIGLHFYPAIQSAHVLLPQTFGIKNVLVPIGPDEDAHIRVARDIAEKHEFRKPAVLHMKFLPGLDGDSKMSKSKGNGIFLLDDEKIIKKKIMNAFSGGQSSIEEHRKLGGNPDVDISYLYMKSLFLKKEESEKIYREYKEGKILSGEMKKMFLDKVIEKTRIFKERYNKVTEKDIAKVVMRNKDIDLEAAIDKLGILSE